MDTYIQPHPNHWILAVGPRSMRLMMMTVIARLAERGPVRVLDSGLQFDGYLISRLLSLSGKANLRERISLSRTSTCRQVLDWLEKADALPAPYIMLDFLSPFYSDSISFSERSKLLNCCISHLDRLSETAGGSSQRSSASYLNPGNRSIVIHHEIIYVQRMGPASSISLPKTSTVQVA